jgi:hypothetical protein
VGYNQKPSWEGACYSGLNTLGSRRHKASQFRVPLTSNCCIDLLREGGRQPWLWWVPTRTCRETWHVGSQACGRGGDECRSQWSCPQWTEAIPSLVWFWKAPDLTAYPGRHILCCLNPFLNQWLRDLVLPSPTPPHPPHPHPHTGALKEEKEGDREGERKERKSHPVIGPTEGAQPRSQRGEHWLTKVHTMRKP